MGGLGISSIKDISVLDIDKNHHNIGKWSPIFYNDII